VLAMSQGSPHGCFHAMSDCVKQQCGRQSAAEGILSSSAASSQQLRDIEQQCSKQSAAGEMLSSSAASSQQLKGC
jgi:hypothetical protein